MSRLLDFLASLRLTVALLVASIVLVFLATLEQVAWGVWHVQDAYFESWGVLYPLAESAPAKFPLPGGFLLGALLCANLVVAHFRHHKPGLARSGISLIHGGLLLLLIGFPVGFAIMRNAGDAAMADLERATRTGEEIESDVRDKPAVLQQRLQRLGVRVLGNRLQRRRPLGALRQKAIARIPD